jgi:hypothetical protein
LGVASPPLGLEAPPLAPLAPPPLVNRREACRQNKTPRERGFARRE